MRTSESDETEILLGNTQLVGIFLVVALLLAVAFYGGYMVGRGGSGRRSATPVVAQEATPALPGGGGETHVVSGSSGTAADQSGIPDQDAKAAAKGRETDAPLGSRRHKAADTAEVEPAGASAGEGFAPQVGQQFLQVAAVSREEAEELADVLHKKGFRAHAVPKPGNAKIYRVIIGPIHDTGDLSSTRDALMRRGFREVILQRY